MVLLGEFINRFSNDMGNIDDVLPDILADAMQVMKYHSIYIILNTICELSIF